MQLVPSKMRLNLLNLPPPCAECRNFAKREGGEFATLEFDFRIHRHVFILQALPKSRAKKAVESSYRWTQQVGGKEGGRMGGRPRKEVVESSEDEEEEEEEDWE